MSDQNSKIQIEVPLRWVDDGSPAIAVNQFVLQHGDGQFHLVLGHVSFPLVTGTPEEQRAEVKRMKSLPVRVRGRFVLDESGLRSLCAILDSQVPEGDR